MTEAAIGLGSNMGDKAGTIARAIGLLDAAPGVTVTARSGFFKTDPWGVTDQDWFVNACVLVETTLSARDLLDLCLAIEARLGRKRISRWGPRVIDLDVLFFGEETIDEAGLTVPHPHMLERAFVLAPLADIAPEKMIAGVSVRDALHRLGGDGIHRLEPAGAAE
ncbi:2-amino-4-hydroxy-6-hydroxymethyldihydropteridine diphosphokinase [Rhodobium gokarnense]|uniref:2-amino-4-hydroxy-6-hydroxymethyldihydropteridine pyrophosphokinase n=1 Tax=Rhodobium gokarnense TaxID=364296 RepID=A0ABT3HDY2_9HYPH|nr:2-amino-4-hydroxy-6-hydroxymethyldihydropteridine diphosphokinase [Rhodobium gokarnense]MCW2308603.1 2-amino-4-hydroxy-6-hydroxymethyldihydropteridine diphosphokinase [Rhodobium gokarnense]